MTAAGPFLTFGSRLATQCPFGRITGDPLPWSEAPGLAQADAVGQARRDELDRRLGQNALERLQGSAERRHAPHDAQELEHDVRWLELPAHSSEQSFEC